MIHEQFVDGLERQKLYSCSEESREGKLCEPTGACFCAKSPYRKKAGQQWGSRKDLEWKNHAPMIYCRGSTASKPV
jgi:hypothetical protein